MSEADDLAAALIRRHEGLRLTAYLDTRGVLTIGYGRNLEVVGVHREEAERMLDSDLADATLAAADFAGPAWASLSDVRRAVLIDMAFQLGAAGLAKFVRLRQALDAGDMGAAAREIASSRAAEQCPGRYAELVSLWREQVS